MGVTVRRLWIALLAAALIAGTSLAHSGAQDGDQAHVSARADRFIFTKWDGPDLPVWYQLPDEVTPETPVVFIMHGVNRDADRYRDEWADLARRRGLIVVVPQFSKTEFPGSLGYNTGYFSYPDGTSRKRALWSFAAIEPLFDDVRRRFGSDARRYSIYGHSAGAQFVHRYIMFMPEARIERAIAANAGWYTMPDLNAAFTYGLAGTPVDAEGLEAALAKPLTIMLGTADIDPAALNLRKTPEAEAQGPHRLARGLQFFALAQQSAFERRTPLAWTLVTVPGIGHSNAGMAEAAAALIAGE